MQTSLSGSVVSYNSNSIECGHCPDEGTLEEQKITLKWCACVRVWYVYKPHYEGH